MSAIGFIDSAALTPQKIVLPSFFFKYTGSLALLYSQSSNKRLVILNNFLSYFMFIAHLTDRLIVIYANTAEATCLDAPNSIFETALAILSILTILPFIPAMSEISPAPGRANAILDCVS